MEIAKLTSKGQITIPIEIRKKLDIKEGDKVLFVEKNGNIVIMNSTMVALRKAQDEFEGEAEKKDIKNEEDVVNLIKELRK